MNVHVHVVIKSKLNVKAGLKITGGQRTMSSQKGGLTGPKLHSLVIHQSRHSHNWKNNKILRAVNLRFCLCKNKIMLTDKKLRMNVNLFFSNLNI